MQDSLGRDAEDAGAARDVARDDGRIGEQDAGLVGVDQCRSCPKVVVFGLADGVDAEGADVLVATVWVIVVQDILDVDAKRVFAVVEVAAAEQAVVVRHAIEPLDALFAFVLHRVFAQRGVEVVFIRAGRTVGVVEDFIGMNMFDDGVAFAIPTCSGIVAASLAVEHKAEELCAASAIGQPHPNQKTDVGLGAVAVEARALADVERVAAHDGERLWDDGCGRCLVLAVGDADADLVAGYQLGIEAALAEVVRHAIGHLLPVDAEGDFGRWNLLGRCDSGAVDADSVDAVGRGAQGVDHQAGCLGAVIDKAGLLFAGEEETLDKKQIKYFTHIFLQKQKLLLLLRG